LQLRQFVHISAESLARAADGCATLDVHQSEPIAFLPRFDCSLATRPRCVTAPRVTAAVVTA
jgi:hypothetical protein